MGSLLCEVERTVEKTRSMLTALLDLGNIPAGDPAEREVDEILQRLLSVVKQIGRTGGRDVHEAGPFVFPLHDTDPRDWPTHLGVSAREAILAHLPRNHHLNEKAETGLCLESTPEWVGRRVLTRAQFLTALAASRPLEWATASVCN